MTQEDIIRMAREAGLAIAYSERDDDGWTELSNFAAIVAAVEREACAKVGMLVAKNGIETSAAIRARSKT